MKTLLHFLNYKIRVSFVICFDYGGLISEGLNQIYALLNFTIKAIFKPYTDPGPYTNTLARIVEKSRDFNFQTSVANFSNLTFS